jgi:hypothetical protein
VIDHVRALLFPDLCRRIALKLGALPLHGQQASRFTLAAVLQGAT